MLGAMTELDRELHADVMAGVYMYDRIPQIDLTRSNPQSSEAQKYRATVQKLTDLALAAGGPGQFDGSPNPNQRAAAVQAGFQYASMRSLVRVGFLTQNEFEQGTGFRSGQTLYEWALTAARRAANPK